jgi:hypothetical protein
VASNQLVVGDGSHEFEVGSTYNVPILTFMGYVPTDPAGITLVLRDPASALSTYTYPIGATLITRSNVGVNAFGFSPVLVGRHVYTVTTTTPNLVSSGEFQVIKQGVT